MDASAGHPDYIRVVGVIREVSPLANPHNLYAIQERGGGGGYSLSPPVTFTASLAIAASCCSSSHTQFATSGMSAP